LCAGAVLQPLLQLATDCARVQTAHSREQVLNPSAKLNPKPSILNPKPWITNCFCNWRWMVPDFCSWQEKYLGLWGSDAQYCLCTSYPSQPPPPKKIRPAGRVNGERECHRDDRALHCTVPGPTRGPPRRGRREGGGRARAPRHGTVPQ
jgi:hypothetical protein